VAGCRKRRHFLRFPGYSQEGGIKDVEMGDWNVNSIPITVPYRVLIYQERGKE